MSNSTFNNLSPDKRDRFINAALEEFAVNDFNSASITQIVKVLGIAKGSVYQYFENKLELWLFLKKHCETTKLGYIKEIKRTDYPDFWKYYRAVYANGINFDLEAPLCSLFLYRVGFKETSNELLPYLNSWKKQANDMFIQLIEAEKKSGSFNKKNSTNIMAHFMVTMSMSVAELLQNNYKVDFEKNIKKGKPLFGGNAKELMKAVDELIKLLEKALK
ncbi:TetR/AcrR family transcriptional regulator [Aurantibacillus circumpalustris]|uniref:TetR/AcrR family transcriptional regulator n=1 Tax=Aurantibacillus circumpalustris TaxID=3036359 RepID=UPI00295A5DAE|nr:TetR/AcrR family transcriptional regulator [Aurantibacillus circumpalustris]